MSDIYEVVRDSKKDWGTLGVAGQSIYNFGTRQRYVDGVAVATTINAVAIANDSTVDSILMFPDGNIANDGNVIVVGVKNPWRGIIDSGRMAIQANGEGMAFLDTSEQTLKLLIYLNGEPYEIPTRRDDLIRPFNAGIAGTTTFNRRWNIRGRERFSLHYRISTDATVGNRTVTVSGVRVVAGQVSAERVLSTVVYPASTPTTDVFVESNDPGAVQDMPNGYDGIEVEITTAGGAHNFRGSLMAMDY